MANKSVYQDFDTDALAHFGLVSTPVFGVLTASSVEDVLVTQDQTTYNKILGLITTSTETDQTFINKKRAFILPRCNVSQDRLKAALKEHKITVTNDYELADLIIGHDDISQRIENGNDIQSTLLMGKLWNMETVTDTSGSFSLIDNHPNEVILTSKITDRVRYYSLDIAQNLYDEWMITGMALNLAHRVATGLASVVDTATILHASANKVELDEDLLGYLKTLLDSYDDDNTLIAAKIIPTIDYTKNPHLMWQFAQDLEYKMGRFSRDKDIQYWIDQSEFNSYSRKSAQDMILWLEETNRLNKISFKYFEPIVRKDIRISNRDLYTFKVSVKPEYLKYL
jgi:hypothetical protein